MSLDGKTPSEMIGINLSFNNQKWLELLRDSLK